jgi:[ribosomal protein S5]-alanine N-acetyltransferase
MLFQPTIETDRLILRPLTLMDAASLEKIASDREIANTTISIPHPYPDAEAERYISTKIYEFQAGCCVTFAIERKAEKLFSGIVEIRDIDREHCQAELSFWLAVEAWEQGYMSEALKPVLRFGFETLSLNRLCAYHMVRNPASGKVLKKNGFVQEGLLRQRVRKWGVFEDVVLLAILFDDWKNQVWS